MELHQLNNNQKAIVYTLIYSDMFDFPLTEEELWKGLISTKKIDKETVKKTIKSLTNVIAYQNGFYCLKGKERTIPHRMVKTANSQEKIKIAKAVAQFLSYIPTIYFIGITGSVSHMDAGMDDDIDLFIITKKSTVWPTRLLSLAILELLDRRRKPNDPSQKNKICLNLIIDQSALSWPKEKQDLYSANEMIHIIPLMDRKNIYQEFLKKNKWITRFYPNTSKRQKITQLLKKPRPYVTINVISFIVCLPLCRKMIANIQKIYMGKKRTNEIIQPNFLAFHPHDYRPEILNNFEARMRQYRLLTNE